MATLSVVRHTVEGLRLGILLEHIAQTRQVDIALDHTRSGVNLDDGIRKVDVCPDAAIDPLQLVNKVERLSVERDAYRLQGLECFGVDAANG